MPQQAKCSSCGATIIWAITKNYKRIPLDAEPVENGNIILADDGVASYISKNYQPGMFSEDKRYVSHFATCPNAKHHRKAK